MGRSLPQECGHGRVIDHGDFGDEWEPYRDLCPECMPADKCADATEWYRLANREWLEPYHREWYAAHDDKTAERVAVAVAEWEHGVDRVVDLAEVTAERDRLRAAIEAIPRHQAWVQRPTECWDCSKPWPCPTERAHRAAEATRHGPDCLAGCCDGAKPPCGPCTCGRDEATP